MITKDISEDNLKLEEEIGKLRRSVEELTILNEIATAISSTMELKRLTDLILQKCIKHINAEQGAVMLFDEKDETTPFHTMIRKADASTIRQPLRFDSQLTGWMLKNRQPLLINDLENDKRFRIDPDNNSLIRSFISVPLYFKGKMIGLISIFNKKDGKKFTLDDQKLIAIIAAQSAHVIESARLLEEEKQFILIQQDLKMAKEIQKNLLPKDIPKIDGYDIASYILPARDIGGDYYDFIPLSDNEIAVCIGDVSGKGLPAALLMGNLQATIRGQCIIPSSCKERIIRANRLLYQSTDSSKFATFFYTILDFQKNCLCYCNAGHNYPILFHKDGSYDFLDTGGVILGGIPEYPFEEKRSQLEQGDLLLLYSDGVSEAMNREEVEFGEENVIEIVKNNISLGSGELLERIKDAIKLHTRGATQSDDITIVIIKKDI
jgi:phosphoserine phosphatase RsbU/P